MVLFNIFYIFVEVITSCPEFGKPLCEYYFELFPDKLLISILIPFLEFCLVLSFGKCSFVSSFNLCVCFYVLGRSATSPSPEGVAECGKYLVGLFPCLPSPALRGFPSVGCLHCPELVGLQPLLGRIGGWELVGRKAVGPGCWGPVGGFSSGWLLGPEEA